MRTDPYYRVRQLRSGGAAPFGRGAVEENARWFCICLTWEEDVVGEYAPDPASLRSAGVPFSRPSMAVGASLGSSGRGAPSPDLGTRPSLRSGGKTYPARVRYGQVLGFAHCVSYAKELGLVLPPP